MRRLWRIAFLLSGFAAVLAACPGVFAGDCAPTARVCELVNSDEDIFVGRVVSSMDQTGSIRVQVVRSYRGSASGEIVVSVATLQPELEKGETYLFYASSVKKNSGARRASDSCSTKPLSSVRPDELAILDGLDRGSRTGSVFGSLERKLNFQDHLQLNGIPILLSNGKTTYSGATDREGKFDISGLSPGVYQISAGLPDTLALDRDEPIEIFPHGCFHAYLAAMNNATISGRIALPPGLKVAGTTVSAISATGGGEVDAIADSQGRYTIRGLPTGEYVVGVNTDANPPWVGAPYPPTYFPATRNPEEAKKFVVSGPAHFSAVNISLPLASQIVNVKVTATFENGKPLQHELIGVSSSGYGIRDGQRTNSKGVATLSVLRGERFFLLGESVGAGCLSPVPIGPETYPRVIRMVYSADGCRENFNITHLGVLHASVHDKFGEIPVTVNFPDGAPAYNADVSLMSRRDSVPFVGAFRTDKNGYIGLPVPSNQEFQVRASVHHPGTDCESQLVWFNTDRGIRWQEIRSGQSSAPNWDNVSPSTGPIHLVLAGASCKSGTP
jgi:hypothetical protein